MTSKKVVPARSIKRTCGPGCRFKCEQRVTEEARNLFFVEFWSIQEHARKYDFLLRYVSESPTKEPTDGSKIHHHRTFRIGYRNENISVCQTMFLNTLSISKKMVNTALKKVRDGANCLIDKRGTSKVRPRAIDERKTQGAIEHIKMFRPLPSHFLRKDSKQQYLDGDLNLSRMYALYLE